MTLSALLAASAAVLGYALQVSSGSYADEAIVALTVSIVLSIAAFVVPAHPRVERQGTVVPAAVLVAGLAVQFFLLLRDPPGFYLQAGPGDLRWFYRGVCIAATLSGLLFVSVRWTKRVVFPLLLVAHVGLGWWTLRASPYPSIDVLLFHHGAFAAIERGENPHEQSIPNIYSRANNYGEGLVRDGRVLIGYPYPPFSLALTFIAHKLTGDYRTILLLAMSLAAAAIGYSRSSRISFGAAALFLFTPRTFFVLQQGWTEPLAAMLFALTLFLACRRPRWLWLAAGLLFAVKQYLVLIIPVVFLLWAGKRPSEWGRELGKALLVAVALTLPLFLWNPVAFLNDVVLFQIRQPFRTDALSYLAFIAARTGRQPSMWVPLVAILLATALAIWRAPRTPAGFAAAVSLVFFAAVSFNKQAFCNYYYFIVAALATGAAAADDAPSPALSRGAQRARQDSGWAGSCARDARVS